MRFFFCLILLSCIFLAYSSTINDTDLILCTTSRCSQIIISFSQPLSFPPDCQENNNANNIHDYVLACSIEYRIDYDREQITIDFQAVNDTHSLQDKKPAEFLNQTITLGFNQEVSQASTTIRNYSCNTNDDCARKFYLNTIKELITNGQAGLKEIKKKLYERSLIIGPDARRRCTDSNKTGNKTSVLCQYGYCFAARYIHNEFNKQQENKTQKCDTQELRPYLISNIVHHNSESTESQRVSLEFRGNKNACNRNDRIDIINDILNRYTGWKSIKQENLMIHEKKINLSIKQTIASYVLVLFSLLIQLYF
jgi:hypothetical protein